MCELPTLILVKETTKRIRTAFDGFFASAMPDGLTPLDRHVLFYIVEHPEATSAELQSQQGRSKSSISESLSLLSERGYIEYVVSQEDRREKKILLTDAGKAYVENTHRLAKSFDATLLEGVTAEEEKILRKALEKISLNAERSKNGQ